MQGVGGGRSLAMEGRRKPQQTVRGYLSRSTKRVGMLATPIPGGTHQRNRKQGRGGVGRRGEGKVETTLTENIPFTSDGFKPRSILSSEHEFFPNYKKKFRLSWAWFVEGSLLEQF